MNEKCVILEDENKAVERVLRDYCPKCPHSESCPGMDLVCCLDGRFICAWYLEV